MFKKIYTILVLLFNVIIRRKHYTLTFDRDECGAWYYRFKHWGFNHCNLLMVSGADDLCQHLANGNNTLTVDIIASRKPMVAPEGYHEYVGEDMSKYRLWAVRYLYGRTYTSDTPINKMDKFWICPVTLFVLGRYPQYIYIKKHGE